MKIWNKHKLASANIYLVLDAAVQPYTRLFEILKEAVHAGVDVVQLRDKNGSGRDILEFSQQAVAVMQHQVPFIVNDRVDIALASGADGVHLGQEDLPFAVARELMGPEFLIGVSCQNQAQMQAAQEAGADYIGFGSVYKTKTKPERLPMDLEILRAVCQECRIPMFAIGGIDSEKMAPLVTLGVKRVAVTREICLSADIQQTIQKLKQPLVSVEK